MTRAMWLIVLAVLAFVVLFFIAVFDIAASRQLVQGLFYGGLALFAAGHVSEK